MNLSGLLGDLMELRENEEFIISGLRVFYDFLSGYGYRLAYYRDRDGDYLEFFSRRRKSIVIVYQSWAEPYFDIVLNQRRLFHFESTHLLDKLRSLAEFAKISKGWHGISMEAKMKTCLEFMRQHLVPVIEGKKWIDDVL